MHSVGKFLTLFRKLNLQSYQVGGDEGYGHQLMDRMQEEGFYLHRFNNGSPAKRSHIYANLSAEWWSTVGQLIERRQIIIPNDEKLIAQLTSRRKLYDSKGREKLESKADLRARGVESPDRAPMRSSEQSCSASRPISTGKKSWRTGKESNARCIWIISAQVVADRTSSGDGEGYLSVGTTDPRGCPPRDGPGGVPRTHRSIEELKRIVLEHGYTRQRLPLRLKFLSLASISGGRGSR